MIKGYQNKVGVSRKYYTSMMPSVGLALSPRGARRTRWLSWREGICQIVESSSSDRRIDVTYLFDNFAKIGETCRFIH